MVYGGCFAARAGRCAGREVTRDLLGEVPANPELDQIMSFLKSAGIRRHKANTKRAATMLQKWTAKQIIAGVVLGLQRAKLAGTSPKYLIYFKIPIEEAVAAGPDYVEYLFRSRNGAM